jgi:hypothetical protein
MEKAIVHDFIDIGTIPVSSLMQFSFFQFNFYIDSVSIFEFFILWLLNEGE